VPNPPNGVPIHVGVNCQGISYNAATGQWTIPSGAPRWTVPAVTPVPSGNNLLTWTLSGVDLPSGFNLVFDSTLGIVFNPGWPGSTPALQGDGTYQATDNFLPGPNNRSFYYAINVVLQQVGGTASQPFRLDPDVQNEGSNPVINYVVKGVAV